MSAELKELEEIPAIPRLKLYEFIARAGTQDYPESFCRRDQRLLATFFLLANRCREGLAAEKEDIELQVSLAVLDEEINRKEASLMRLRGEVDIGERLGRDVQRTREELGSLFDEYQDMLRLRAKWDHPGSSLEAVDETATRYPQTRVYVVKLLTLKRKPRVYRVVPVPVVDPLAPLFVEQLQEPGETLFDVTRQRVWQIFKAVGVYDFYKSQGYMVPKNPLRHARLSEVTNVLNSAQLDRLAGWKIKGTADRYVHLKWDDFVLPLVRAARSAPRLEV